MALIPVQDLTNNTSNTEGTGIFDVLMKSVDLQVQEEWNQGRITGAEFATVYLAAIQAVLQQSVSFLLSKQEADKKADLLDVQILEEKASTRRKDDESVVSIIKVEEETDLLQSKDLEEIAATIRKDAESKAKIIGLNYDIAIKAQQEYQLREKNGFPVTTYTYFENGIDGTKKTTTDISGIVGSIIGTKITKGSGISVVALDKEILVSKDKLIDAQTLGFASDTKQKLLKQMNDGFAVVLSIAGKGNVPESNQDAAIDMLTQEILKDVGSLVVVPTGEASVPALD